MVQRAEHKEEFLLMMEALDGQIAPEKLAQLDNHLSHCSACAHQWESLNAIHQLFLQSPVLSPASDFTMKTLSRLPSSRNRIIALGVIYGLLLVSGLIPLGLFLWFASQIQPALSLPTILNGFLQGFEQILQIGQTVLGAVLQVVGTFGVLLDQQPALIGLIIAMIGVILVWGGVYGQMTRQTRNRTIN